jgi:hypothetical protein
MPWRLPCSLVTEDPYLPGSCTMNIVTYASPVAINPERHYALGEWQAWTMCRMHCNLGYQCFYHADVLILSGSRLACLLGRHHSGHAVPCSALCRDAEPCQHDQDTYGGATGEHAHVHGPALLPSYACEVHHCWSPTPTNVLWQCPGCKRPMYTSVLGQCWIKLP